LFPPNCNCSSLRDILVPSIPHAISSLLSLFKNSELQLSPQKLHLLLIMLLYCVITRQSFCLVFTRLSVRISQRESNSFADVVNESTQSLQVNKAIGHSSHSGYHSFLYLSRYYMYRSLLRIKDSAFLPQIVSVCSVWFSQ
jgi:hypothetical protein